MFVGGGTPSLVGPVLTRALAAIPVSAGAEVTVECNPDDVTDELFAAYAAAGVNRISLGVQSMVPRVLALLGRQHDPDNVVAAVETIGRVGFASFNMDLIYGAATETLDEWGATLHAALALDPPHISAYGLTVEAGTPLAADPARHPDDDVQADEYEFADEVLTAAGLVNYEVSNWARRGHESRHNRLYWDQHDYFGFGCAAHSHVAGRRWWNVRTPSATSQPSPLARPPRPPAKRSTRDRVASRVCSSRCAPHTACPGRAARRARGPRGTKGRSRRADRPRPPARERGRVATQLRGGSSKT